GVVSMNGEAYHLKDDRNSPRLGSWVRARIDSYPTERSNASVTVDEILGDRLEPRHDGAIAIARFGLWSEFSDRAHADAIDGRRLALEGQRDLQRRKDLRALPFV